MLRSKKILIFVSGSIAVYKILMLIRILRQEHAEVRVIATKSALKFVTQLSFEALSGNEVLHDDNECWVANTNQEVPMRNHIGYARWADIAIFAPMSANCINKLAQGIADTIYLSSALALRNIPKLIAPSANTFMLHNPLTQQNLERLQHFGFTLIPAIDGNLACGEVGNGAMASIDEIAFAIKRALHTKSYWQNKSVIITGGGSSEGIDSVRCISNHSSGLQACNLALALYYFGAKVTLITSKIPFLLPKQINIIRVTSSQDYYNALQEIIETSKASHNTENCLRNGDTQDTCLCHSDVKDSNISKIYLFMAAAISDYIPIQQQGKLKKQDLGQTMTLQLQENRDILQSIRAKNLIKIGFKAECDVANALDHARLAMQKKGCAMICLNIITDENKSFGTEDNEMYFLTQDSETKIKGTKFEVSIKLCEYIQKQGI